MKIDNSFPAVFWGKDKSTKAQFCPCEDIFDSSLVTSCMVCAVHENKILLAKPPRGWGLPGGRIELGETPEDCARREVYEETSVELNSLKLIGAWHIEKLFHSEYNGRYPDRAYQLLFLADVKRIDDFVASHESSAREFVEFDKVQDYHHDFANFAEIMRYIRKCIRRQSRA